MTHLRLLTEVALLILLSLSQPAAAQTLLRVATPGALTGALPIYLGAKRGVFQRYGLTVEVIATRNEQMNMQALMSDSVQFLTSSSTGLFYLGKQGLDAVGVASWNNASPYSLGSRFKIKELKELKGKKIASSGAGGRADAFINFMLTKAGFKRLVNLADLFKDPSFSDLAATGKTIKENPQFVKRMVRAIVRGVIHSRDYPEDAIQTMIKHWHMERDVSVDAYNLVKEALIPVPTEKGVELMAHWQSVALNVQPKRPVREYMDLRFVKEVMVELEKK